LAATTIGQSDAALGASYRVRAKAVTATTRKMDGVMRLSVAELSALREGLDWRRVHEAREMATPNATGLMIYPAAK